MGTDLDITALPSIPDASAEQTKKDSGSSNEYVACMPAGRRRASRFATELYTVSYLIFFSIFGTLARLGMQWLTFYPGTPTIFPVLWANFAGTLFMGFLSEDRRLFRQDWGNRGAESEKISDEEKGLDMTPEAKASHAKVKKTIPLYIGLATGFCGSFTSFSSFMRDTFYALSNDLPSPLNHPSPVGTSTTSTVPRHNGDSFMAVCAVIISTVALCYSALKVGAHIAIYTDRIIPTLPFRLVRRVLDPLTVILAWGIWIGAVMMAIWPPDRPGGPQSKGSWANETWRGQAIFACVFAPVGCILRFYASVKLNGLISSFPLGTFAVNVFGTAVLGMAFDLQHVSIGGAGVGGGRITCQVLQGIMDGFCGALTTVSTWILELNALRRGHAYIYGATSVGAGFAILVAVMGSVRWSVGWTAPMCVT
jgi:fluoride ion exporter CrcB/FEX